MNNGGSYQSDAGHWRSFTSAEDEMQSGKEQTQMLGCLLCQNSFQTKRQIEIEIHYIDPGFVLVKYVRRFLLFVFISVSQRYNKYFRSLSSPLFAMSQSQL